MKISKKQKDLLLALFESKSGLQIHSLYNKYQGLFGELYKDLLHLTEIDMVIKSELSFEITETGKSYITSNPHLYKRESSSVMSKGIPPNFLAPRIKINEFYLNGLAKHRKSV